MHWNSVVRGLVREPQDRAWSYFCHDPTGEEGVVEIEPEWTAEGCANAWASFHV